MIMVIVAVVQPVTDSDSTYINFEISHVLCTLTLHQTVHRKKFVHEGARS